MCSMSERMTVREFYGDERRRASEESTFGVAWALRTDPGALYGLHWLKATKEIYLLRGPVSPPFLPGVFEGAGGGRVVPAFADDQYRVIVLGRVRRASEVERALKGWRGVIGTSNSLQWVMKRLDQWVDTPDLGAD
jgi:hypothetical protein